MPQLGQMIDSFENAAVIVDDDAAYIAPGHLEVNDNHGNLPCSQLLGQIFGDRGGHDGHASHAVLDHFAHRRVGACRIVIRRAKEEVVLLGGRGGLEAFHDFREDRIFHIGDEQSEKVAATTSRQALRVALR